MSISKIKSYLRGHSGVAVFLALLVIIFAVVGGRIATKKPVESSAVNTKGVSLVEVATFRDDLSIVSVEGIVESASQVDIKSQVSAPVSKVYFDVGDNVSQGQVIMEFQNADIRAQLAQAKANLELVKAQYTVGNVTLSANEKVAIDRIRDSYSTAEDIINAQIRPLVFSSENPQVRFQQFITDTRLIDSLSIDITKVIEELRIWGDAVDRLSDSATSEQINTTLTLSTRTLSTIQAYLTLVAEATINVSQIASAEYPTYVSKWKATVSTARGTINGLVTTLTSTNTSLSTSQAQMTIAEAGVRGLEAQLAKTIIVAPISGTIAVLPLREGELTSPGLLVTTIVGSGALEIKAYASREDVDRIEKGASVIIDGIIRGVVSNISPSVNQLTKKVEVKIKVSAEDRAHLVVGQSIQAKIKARVLNGLKDQTAKYMLPIQNIKILPSVAYVYTVDLDNKVVKNEVTLGDVRGGFVEVTKGLTDDMRIVSPVYGLEEGEKIKVQ